jgi:sulfatase maturation enzyme AslB (radical SAM superfamily)
MQTVDNKDLSEYFCHHPFDNFEPRENGDVCVCCYSWLPVVVGNINESSAGDVFNSDKVVDIRKSILDGSFKYCDRNLCPKIISKSLKKKSELTCERHIDIVKNSKVFLDYPLFINFVNDDSCNLKCPSCRVIKRNIYSGEEYEKRLKINTNIVNWILSQDIKEKCLLSITGSGDPFASKIYRDFLFSFDGEKHMNIEINLQTNGVMLTPKIWNKISKIHKNINTIIISLDAATEDVYNKIRIGGDWKTLINNVKHLGRQRDKIHNIRLDFVVQDTNYYQMPDFVNLAKSIDGVSAICFSKIINWGTFMESDFNRKAIWKKEHKEHSKFLEILRAKEIKDSIVDMSNLYDLYEEANK